MKLCIGILFGGSSVEHEISIISAVQALNVVDVSKYDVLPIYITKNRDVYTSDLMYDVENFKNTNNLIKKSKKIKFTKNGVHISKSKYKKIDVIIPIMHGTYGEDGTIAAFLEMYDIPYSTCDVSSAVIGQDKVFTKEMLKNFDIPIVNYSWVYDIDYIKNKEEIISDINFPVIIKPARLGSSIGIQIAKTKEEFENYIFNAFKYDKKVIIEEYIEDIREINCSVIGDYQKQEVSLIEEVLFSDVILTFDDKYQNQSSKSENNRIIPANITIAQKNRIEELSKKAFKIIGASGVIRIDFIMKDNDIYLNEINTIPGSLSYYLWKDKGITYRKLINKLIKIALKKEEDKKRFIYTYNSNVLNSNNYKLK